jgi:hypothetical protein
MEEKDIGIFPLDPMIEGVGGTVTIDVDTGERTRVDWKGRAGFIYNLLFYASVLDTAGYSFDDRLTPFVVGALHADTRAKAEAIFNFVRDSIKPIISTPVKRALMPVLSSQFPLNPVGGRRKSRGGCGCMVPQTGGYKMHGGYRATKKDKKYLNLYKKGKSIGFTMTASLKAKGLIKRANGTKRVSKKYRR